MALKKRLSLLNMRCHTRNTFYAEKLSFRRESNEMSDRRGLTGATHKMLDGQS